jgi:hypothetical protein
MKLTTPAEVVATSPYRFFLYGEPGVGKTTLLGQAPKPLILAAPPDEVISIRDSDAQVLTIESWEDAVSAIETAANGNPRLQDYETVVVDTLTHIRSFAVQHALDLNRGKFSQAVWTEANRLLTSAVTTLLQSPKPVVMIGHHRYEKNDDGSIRRVLPDFGEGFLRVFLARMNAAFYYRSVGNKRELLLTAVPGIDVKNRYGLPDKLVNPTYAELLSAINTYREKASEATS